MKRILLVVAPLLGLVACGEDENKPLTLTERLLARPWIITGQTRQTGADDPVNNFPNLEPCRKDDKLRFQPNGVFEYDEGLDKCVATDPQTRTGTWSLVEADSTLTYKVAGIDETQRIDTLGAALLVLRKIDNSSSPVVQTLTIYSITN